MSFFVDSKSAAAGVARHAPKAAAPSLAASAQAAAVLNVSFD